MSLENELVGPLNRLISYSLDGPDKKPDVFYEWANGREFLDPEETMEALIQINTMNYAVLAHEIRRVFTEDITFSQLMRLTPTIGDNSDGKSVVYLVLTIAPAKRARP